LPSFGDRACRAAVRGENCPYLDTEAGCKYNHDLAGMLATRPPDLHLGKDGASWLEGKCPFFRYTRGYCDFGIMCRLGSCHVNMSTGENLRRNNLHGGDYGTSMGEGEGAPDAVQEVAVAADTAAPFGHYGDITIMNVLSKETQILGAEQ
jgi:hypothetical protein